MSTVAIIQARYSSTRFPGKALADLCGKPVVQHVIERAQQIAGVDRVVLAMPRADGEEPLHDWARAYTHDDYYIDSGDVNDVLGRFVRCVESMAHRPDNIMRITGDCPLLQPEVCGRLIEMYNECQPCHYAWLNTHDGSWPDGLDCEVFPRNALVFTNSLAKDDAFHREHVTSYMRSHSVWPFSGSVRVELPADPSYAGWPKCSVDVPADLERVRQMMARRG